MDNYTELAQKTVEVYIREYEMISVPADLPADFYNRKAGVFVTIFNGEDLRGCIGTYLPVEDNIATEIVRNALSACSNDYRFSPISAKELPQLRYEVSVLSSPEPVQDIEKLHPKKDGIIVRCTDGRCGLLLPDLDGVKTVQDQIFIACQKGGIDPVKDEIKLFSFTVEKHV